MEWCRWRKRVAPHRALEHEVANNPPLICKVRHSTRNKTSLCRSVARVRESLCCACSWFSLSCRCVLIFALVEVSRCLSFVFIVILSCPVRTEIRPIALPVGWCCGSQWFDWSDRRRKVPEHVPGNCGAEKPWQEAYSKLVGHTSKFVGHHVARPCCRGSLNSDLANVDKEFGRASREMQASMEKVEEAQRLVEISAQAVHDSRQVPPFGVCVLWEDGISPWSNSPHCASLGVIDIGDGVPGRIQVQCGREEVNNWEKQEKDKHEETDNGRSSTHHGWHEDVIKCANCMRKMTCEVYLSAHTVGHSGSPSTVNETNCNKKKITLKNHMSSFPIPFRLVPPRCAWRRMPYPVLFWRNRLFNLFAWLVVETIFHWESSSKIGSKFYRPIFVWFLQGETPLSLESSLFLWSETICMVLFCKFVQLFALLFCPSDCELWFTTNWISEESIVSTCKISTMRVNFLAASLPRIPGYTVLFSFFGFAMSSTMTASFLYHVVRDRECVQSLFFKLSSGFAVNQELFANAVHNSLIPIKKTERTLYFWKVSHNSNNSTLPDSRIIAFELLLNGL